MSAEPLTLLRTLSPSVELALLLDVDGQILAASPPMDEDDEMTAVATPLLTTLGGIADRVTRELGRGGLEQMVLRGPSGHIVVADLADGRLLAVVARPAVRLGLLLDDVSAVADQLSSAAA
ncbi:MAG: roadblock/LC7 domain-containing protein [Myxococcota bacterium]